MSGFESLLRCTLKYLLGRQELQLKKWRKVINELTASLRLRAGGGCKLKAHGQIRQRASMNTGTTGPPGMLAASSTQVPLSYLGCFCKGKGLYRYPAQIQSVPASCKQRERASCLGTTLQKGSSHTLSKPICLHSTGSQVLRSYPCIGSLRPQSPSRHLSVTQHNTTPQTPLKI